MRSGASRVLGLLAVGVLIPACNLTITNDDPAPGPGSQNPFTLTKPLTAQTGVWPTNTQFTWGAEPGALTYTFELSLTSDFTQIIYTASNLADPWHFLPVSLTHGTTYYWRVSTDEGGITVYAAGSGQSFTTVVPLFGPPVAFFLQSPLGTTAGRSPTFVWSYAQEAASYSLQIYDTNPSTPIVDLENLHLTRAVCPVVLDANKTYFWQVTAANSGGTRPSSPTSSSFFTGP